MNLDTLRLLNGECLIKVRTLVEDEVEFAGTTLKIVTDAKDFIQEASYDDAKAALDAYKRSGYKDEKAIAEYTRMMGELGRKADENKVDMRAKQSVRKGEIVKISEGRKLAAGFDYECIFDGEVGDEVFFDPYYSHAMLEDDQRYFEEDGMKLVLVPKEAIFARKRDGYESLNGFILGEVLENELRHGLLHLPDSDTARVRVTVAPTRQPKYRSPLWSNTEVKVGDIVCIKDHFAIPLDSTMGSETKLVRFQSRVINAIEI